MNKLLLDLRYIVRLLAKSPAFALNSLVIIVLGIALYLCTHSLVYNFSNAPLAYERGDRFVAVQTIYATSGRSHFGVNFDAYGVNQVQERARSFEELWAYRYAPLTISDGEFPQQYVGAAIQPQALAMPRVEPMMGRLLQVSDTGSGTQPVAVISYDVWQNYYAGDADIIGTTSRINGEPYTIVGVMPEGFDYPYAQDVWVPLSLSQGAAPDRELDLAVMGVLKPDVTVEAASREIDELVQSLAEEYPNIYGASPNGEVVRHASINVNTSGVGGLLRLLNNAVLALVALNFGILLFYRAHSRQRELAVRCALGASRVNIARQVMLESALLCGAGLLISLVVAAIFLFFIDRTVTHMYALAGATPQSWLNFSIDGHSIIVALTITIGLWLCSGLWVAFRTSRVDANAVLAAGTKGSGGQGSHWLTRLIVGVEVTASCFLLIVSTLLFVLIVKLYQVDFGVPTGNVMTASLQLRGAAYSEPDQRLRLVQSLQRKLNNHSRFETGTIARALPGQAGDLYPYTVEDRDLGSGDNKQFITNIAVTETYFDALEIPLLEGRSFNSGDTRDSIAVTVIGERLARQLWPDQSAIGKRIGIELGDSTEWLTVVGVSRHVIHNEPTGGQENRPALYRPVTQHTPYWFHIAAKQGPGMSDAEAIRELKTLVKQEDRDLAVTNSRTLRELLDSTIFVYSLLAKLAVFFGLVTLVFSIVGVYGLISRSVAARTQEVGIRLSLGSDAKRVMWLFLRQGALYLGAGVVIGGAAAIVASDLLTQVFSGALASLTPVFIGVIAVMGAMILLASYLPARQAVALEPGDALRDE